MAKLTRLVLAPLALALLASGPGDGGAPSHLVSIQAVAATRESFTIFWPRFRAAVLRGDTDQLSEMTQFPLEVRGALDSSAVRRVARSQFAGIMAATLAQDSGLSMQSNETNRALVDRVQRADPTQRGVSISASTARIGPFGFACGASEWRLVRIYSEDDG